ncbi:hypothetical protein [Streptomyces olivochromogenes]|uniref:hypothetical protein n=1 Tax=Streptomyces olivochromogenes TaxID=1963 RepID=UPI001F46554C|nr:hypothetical protein [Streptomyces olivochromogenes]MCF3128838.1 hypothetical protein [Streptomyces olivochromogenes]
MSCHGAAAGIVGGVVVNGGMFVMLSVDALPDVARPKSPIRTAMSTNRKEIRHLSMCPHGQTRPHD